MKPGLFADRWLALFFLAFGLVLVFVWAPLDTGSGIVETVRRRLIIGDALGPSVAGAIILLGAILVWARPAGGGTFTRLNVLWMIYLGGLLALSLVVMRYAGPVVALATESGYRPLRATPPWNYIGFVIGGTVLIGGLTGLAAKRLSLADFAIGFAAALAIAVLYDLPFDDLILPPNGDV